MYHSSTMPVPELSLVIPAYNEAVHLEAVVAEITRALEDAGINYQICIVNNGSTDDTAAVIQKIKSENSKVTTVHLEKNQHYGGGILAGLEVGKGTTLGWIHADGQANPKDLVRMYKGMRESGRELGKAV